MPTEQIDRLIFNQDLLLVILALVLVMSIITWGNRAAEDDDKRPSVTSK